MSELATTAPVTDPIPMASLMGLRLACIDCRSLVDHIFASLGKGRGGWLITANLDFLRRYVGDPEARRLYDAADIRVADGMPLVWACSVQGDKLPERVAGSSLVWPVIERAAREGRSLYLLGGAPGASARAAKVLVDKHPSLNVCGATSPTLGSPPSSRDIELVVAELEKAKPDILFVGLGSPKQEQLIRVLRQHLPSTWMVGVGISFSFIAGDLKRAPAWMRKMGIEWVHRLIQDPRRLTKRYLVEDLPFVLRLFPHALGVRLQRAHKRD